MKAQFVRKSDGSCDIKFVGLTQGKALALCHALESRAANSVVAQDIVIPLRRAIQEDTSFQKHADLDQDLFECLGEWS